MKMWNKYSDGSVTYYVLDKNFSPDYYATVYTEDGKWTFKIGLRIKDDSTNRTMYIARDKWKSPGTAKTKAYRAILIKRNEETDSL